MPSPRIVPTGVLGGRPGRDGRDGSNVLPTGEAIADSIENDETVKASLSASIDAATAPLVEQVEAVPGLIAPLDTLITSTRADRWLDVARTGGSDAVDLPDGVTVTVPATTDAIYDTTLTGTTAVVYGDNPVFRYTNCRLADQTPGAPHVSSWRWNARPPVSDSGGANVNQAYVVDVLIDSADCEMVFVKENSTASIEAWCDGRRAIPLTQVTGAGEIYHVKIADTTYRRVRHWRFRVIGLATWHLYYRPTDTIARPSVPLYSSRLGVLGDSYPAGAQDVGWGSAFHGQIARELGVETLVNGWSSTGYIATAGGAAQAKYADRLDELAGEALDYLLIVGSQNDNPSTNAAIYAAATACYAQAATLMPDTKLFVVGPAFIPSQLGAALTANENAVSAAAQAAPNVLGYISTVGWFTGTGKIDAPANDGNADRYVAQDANHPSHDGHIYMGRRIAAEMGRLLATAA